MATMTASIRAADQVDLAGLFESVYREARGDARAVPWADGVANPSLVAWLNVIAPRLVRCGGRVAVVGCGLGDDARELIRRGYEVIAFDISPTAVEWAKRLDPGHEDRYHVADLFDPPPKWRHRFDLVVESCTLQSLPPALRPEAMRSIADLVGPHGRILVICRATTESVVGRQDEPPWPLTKEELLETADAADLDGDGPVDEFMDQEDPPVRRMRAVFCRRPQASPARTMR